MCKKSAPGHVLDVHKQSTSFFDIKKTKNATCKTWVHAEKKLFKYRPKHFQSDSGMHLFWCEPKAVPK
jgi:hypothetical protein